MNQRPASILLACVLFLLPASLRADDSANGDPVEKSVVKIFSTVRYPDHFKPWNKQSPSDRVGSGVVIDGKRILTAAHVVLYASQIQIQANEEGDKIVGHVAEISPETDLAIIKLDDDSFFDNHPPLPRADKLPDFKDTVMAYGFPTGGTSLSITKGIVSRIEFTKYNSGAAGLRIQVDAAVNPGNSGGPALVDGKMIGLTFAHLTRAENISYIIPCEEIELFLKGVAQGNYHGRPILYVAMQGLQNATLRTFLRAGKSVHGAVVQRAIGNVESFPLRKWDIVTHIADSPIDDEGMVHLPSGLRVAFTYLIEKTMHDNKVPLTIVRDGKVLHVEAPVISRPPLVMPPLEGSYPSYFVYGPLVFSDASTEMLVDLIEGSASRVWTPALLDHGSPLIRRCDDSPAFPGERLVVVTTFFPDPIGRGYADPTTEVVKYVNGTPIKNLAQLVQVLRDCRDPFVVFDFQERASPTLVFPRQEMISETDEILSENSVRSQGSADMMAIWEQKNK